ncbi:hypothetical protein [Levilactobacillus brevis]|uniref:hypothetical protein n=1 Tax=Levilactobacillus brevis TaxID=1580 RepID=UPI00111924CB|nr:hypothetical protein [Levilactobacillus brevis]QCZ44467.1 hypothetical protein UCCLBBS124_2164 [Levilactobacillus brevis]
MSTHITLSGINSSLSVQLIGMAYQLFQEDFLAGQTYWDKDLTLKECCDWLVEIDEKLGEVIKQYMCSSQYLSVFTGIEDNQIKRMIVIGKRSNGYEWKVITAEFLRE